MKFKNFIWLYRRRRGFSQYTLAKLVGVSRNAISSFERQQYQPSAEVAYHLCKVLCVTFEELFYFEV